MRWKSGLAPGSHSVCWALYNLGGSNTCSMAGDANNANQIVVFELKGVP
jgi:hypothetical protein